MKKGICVHCSLPGKSYPLWYCATGSKYWIWNIDIYKSYKILSNFQQQYLCNTVDSIKGTSTWSKMKILFLIFMYKMVWFDHQNEC